jgi:hypothetical protein
MCLRYVQRKPWTYLASRLMVSLYGPKRDSTWPISHRSTIGCAQNDFWAYGTFGANRAPIMHRDQHYLQTNRIELPFHPCHLRIPSGAPNTISMLMVHLVQTMHVSCVKINTISIPTKKSIHFTHVTYEIYRLRPKWLWCPRYIRCKPSSYLASRLILSPNRLKQVFTWYMSRRSTIGCAQNNFWAYGTFGTNHAPLLRRD